MAQMASDYNVLHPWCHRSRRHPVNLWSDLECSYDAAVDVCVTSTAARWPRGYEASTERYSSTPGRTRRSSGPPTSSSSTYWRAMPSIQTSSRDRCPCDVIDQVLDRSRHRNCRRTTGGHHGLSVCRLLVRRLRDQLPSQGVTQTLTTLPHAYLFSL